MATHIIGVDEVGRGPIAGPVTVGAMRFFDSGLRQRFLGIKDSKKLSKKQREEKYREIVRGAENDELAFAVASVGEKIIDTKGIMFALRLATARVLRKVSSPTEQVMVLLDGGLTAPSVYAQQSIVRGDETIPEIALASIVAKIARDEKMTRYGKVYTGYGFERNYGYGTSMHYDAIAKQGTCKVHRLSFIH